MTKQQWRVVGASLVGGLIGPAAVLGLYALIRLVVPIPLAAFGLGWGPVLLTSVLLIVGNGGAIALWLFIGWGLPLLAPDEPRGSLLRLLDDEEPPAS